VEASKLKREWRQLHDDCDASEGSVFQSDHLSVNCKQALGPIVVLDMISIAVSIWFWNI